MDAAFQDITALSGLAALVVKVRVLRGTVNLTSPGHTRAG